MKINNNIAALSVLNELNRNSNKLGCMAEKAASGVCINFAGDDASGYSISEKMRVQLRSLAQDVENVQTGRNMVAVAEGGFRRLLKTYDISRKRRLMQPMTIIQMQIGHLSRRKLMPVWRKLMILPAARHIMAESC